MDQAQFEREIRKFLKKVGINSQREIEAAVHAAAQQGDLAADKPLQARMTLEIPAVGLRYTVEDELRID